MMTSSNTPRQHRSATSWKSSKSDVGDESKHRKAHRNGHLSIGQALLVSAMCASFAAVLTALIAVYCFSNSLFEMYSDQMVASTMSSVVQRTTRLRPVMQMSEGKDAVSVAVSSEEPLILAHTNDASIMLPSMVLPAKQDDGIRPNLAWLMSFPNSGTSFTIHMTREATNCTTATNYALEGDITDKPSVPAIQGPVGDQGPWLELIPDRFTTVPETILTKTHCKGFCNGKSCGPDKTIHTVRSFMIGCLSGTRAIEMEDGSLEKVHVTYKPERVKKAIHIFRHPFDNQVARFHLEFNVQTMRGNAKFTQLFPKNSTGFHRWCAADDMNRDLIKSRFVDHRLRESMQSVPCFNDFFRYTQWHNLAFAVSHEMALPTMILHYHEYSDDFENTRDRILDFLDLTRVGEGIEFHSGKEYRDYYTLEQKMAIKSFLQEFASAETWEQLKDYDYGAGQPALPQIERVAS